MCISVPPSVPTFTVGYCTGPGPINAIEGTALNITCASTGNPAPVPDDYTWTGVNITNVPDDYTWTGANIPNITGQVLSVPNIKTGDVYMCNVETTLTLTGGRPENRWIQSVERCRFCVV